MHDEQYKGEWCFNGNPEITYVGILNNSDGYFRVELIGCLKVPKGILILHGTSTNGKLITLNKCYASAIRFNMPEIPTIEVTSSYCFIGQHLQIDEFQFNSLRFNISSLNLWIDAVGFENFTSTVDSFSLEYKKPNPIIFYKTEELEFSFNFSPNIPLWQPSHKLNFNQETYISIKHTSTFDIDAFWEYLSSIKNFFTLAYFSEVTIESIYFTRNGKNINFSYARQKKSDIKIKDHKTHYLFTYSDIESNFIEIFGKWVALRQKIKPVIEILDEYFTNGSFLTENKFLNLMQAIETFHRRQRKNERIIDEVHSIKVKQIVEACPNIHKEWLIDILKLKNEPYLNERLLYLFNELDDELKTHLFENITDIIKDAVNSRNYYTHYDTKYEKKALKSYDLYLFSERLKVFLLYLLLKEAGIEKKKLSSIIIQSSTYLFNHLIIKKKQIEANENRK